MMKTRKHLRVRMLLVSLLSVALIGTLPAQAQTNRSNQPQNFKTFWLRFKTAIARNDKEAVASMTKLPFLFDNQELDRAGFVRRYNEIFSRRDKRCFARAKPLKDGDSYSVFCGQIIFVFSREDGDWKLSSFGPND